MGAIGLFLLSEKGDCEREMGKENLYLQHKAQRMDVSADLETDSVKHP